MSSNFTDPPDSIAEFDHEEWQEAHDGPKPADLRDEIQGPSDWLQPAVAGNDDLADVTADGGLDVPRPEDQRRPAFEPGQITQVTRDPSLSRAAELRAAGVDPEDVHGMSDPSEIGHPGPIAPDAADQPAAAEGEPAGQWGSSGSPTD
jgi:hypothetical protein